MAGDVSTPLSAKEIKRLRQGVTHRKWISAAFAFFILLQLAGATSKLYQLHLLVPGITWKQIHSLGLARNFPVNGTYSGVEIRAASLAEDACVYLILAGLMVGAHLVIRSLLRKDIVLLHYIDREGKA